MTSWGTSSTCRTCRIQVHGPHMTTSKTLAHEFHVFCSRWQFLLCWSDFTIYALLPEAICDRCAPRMWCDTSRQAQYSWRSFPIKYPCSTPSQRFPQCHICNSFNVLMDDGLFHPFQAEHRVPSLPVPLSCQWLMIWCLALILSQVPQYSSSSNTKDTCDGCFIQFPIYRVVSLDIHESSSKCVSEDGYQTLSHPSLTFSFHFSYFVTSSFNLWKWWHV